MKRYNIVVDSQKPGIKRVLPLIDMALQFASESDLGIFELEVVIETRKFVKDFNDKSFVLKKIGKLGNYWGEDESAEKRVSEIITGKGIINEESIKYLRSIRSHFGLRIPKIILRAPFKNEQYAHLGANRPYSHTVNWLRISTDYCIMGNLDSLSLEKLYKTARNFGNYSQYFSPLSGYVLITEEDPRKPPSKDIIVHHIDKKGVRKTTKAKFYPPFLLTFTSAKELRDANRMSSIRLSRFTKSELARICRGWGLKRYEQAVVHLIERALTEEH